MNVQQTSLPIQSSATSTPRLAQIGLAIFLGLFVVGVSGFSHIEAIHNAAHDVRHSLAFPCH
ncbi:CbtB domain-containing protein [Microvirga flavescens]|uniref:CbtB domain-containing protein n=1 Tax=Microvirga flavescens TaxID=2249811 RepID=UPI000DD5CFE5|nr:CbtB-domain containing protein [Microvirga flavescens]